MLNRWKMNKKGAVDIGSSLVWVPVMIIVFFGMILFMLAVLFLLKPSSIDVYKEVSNNGIVQYEMLNALMAHNVNGQKFQDELERYFRGEKINADLGQVFEEVSKKRGEGCYLFSVNVPTSSPFERYISKRFRIEGDSVSTSGYVQTVSFDKNAVLFYIDGKEGRFYSGRC